MKHALDFSAPRISDLPLVERKVAMVARDAGRREAYQRQMAARIERNSLPLRVRFLRALGLAA